MEFTVHRERGCSEDALVTGRLRIPDSIATSVIRRSLILGFRSVRGKPDGLGVVRQCCDEVAHLRSEFLTLRNFLRETDEPIKHGRDVGEGDDPVESVIEAIQTGFSHALIHMQESDRQADERKETQTGGDLHHAITPAEREQLTERCEGKEKQNTENRARDVEVNGVLRYL